jgi:hypothetical protein
VLAIELRSRTAKADLHSSLGAVFDNALWRLAAVTAALRDAAGRVTIEGFYDAVRQPSRQQSDLAAQAPFSLNSLIEATGAQHPLEGRDEASSYKAMNFEPCVNVNGFLGGIPGRGPRLSCPPRALSKSTFGLCRIRILAQSSTSYGLTWIEMGLRISRSSSTMLT